jgi:hypothetical protein
LVECDFGWAAKDDGRAFLVNADAVRGTWVFRLLNGGGKNLLDPSSLERGDHGIIFSFDTSAVTASAMRMPSQAADVMPPAYPAPSPQG